MAQISKPKNFQKNQKKALKHLLYGILCAIIQIVKEKASGEITDNI